MTPDGYINGFIERVSGGSYRGRLSIDGVDISPIDGVYFKEGATNYLWLKRRRILEYDDVTDTYKERDAKPKWESYLKKQSTDGVVAYKGEFVFMRFRFTIIGVWDRILGKDKRHRLNLFVERMSINQQTIINSINERKRNEKK